MATRKASRIMSFLGFGFNLWRRVRAAVRAAGVFFSRENARQRSRLSGSWNRIHQHLPEHFAALSNAFSLAHLSTSQILRLGV